MNRLRIFRRKIPCRKFIRFKTIAVDRLHQPVVSTDRQEIDTETFFSLNIGISVSMLIQVSHNGKKGRLISMETAPGMKAYIRLSIFLPGSDRKQNCGNSCRHLKM